MFKILQFRSYLDQGHHFDLKSTNLTTLVMLNPFVSDRNLLSSSVYFFFPKPRENEIGEEIQSLGGSYVHM